MATSNTEFVPQQTEQLANEKSPLASTDPTLRNYFKYMVSNRNVSIQFSSRKIRDIIEKDLEIKLNPSDTLYIKVCTEAFAYYIQKWPEWSSKDNYTYSEESYKRLKQYLNSKLRMLKEIEKVYNEKSTKVNTIALPANCEKLSLKISIPNHLLLSNHTVKFTKVGDDLMMELQATKRERTTFDFAMKCLFNYPFISVEFKIPGLMKITRTTPFRIDQYLLNKNNIVHPKVPKTHIRNVEFSKDKKHNVYNYFVLRFFFNQLKVVLTKLGSKISETRRLEIDMLTDTFLEDIRETHIVNNTICETAAVGFNIGHNQFYSDVLIETEPEFHLVHRKIITPIAGYCLDFCTIAQHQLSFNNIEYFNFTRTNDVVFETVFVQYINACMTYKCTICDKKFKFETLKEHLANEHHVEEKLQCVLCSESTSFSDLLRDRWRHSCTESTI